MSIAPSTWSSIKRFLRPFSGTTDINGNLTIKFIPFNAYWSSFVVAGQASGNPIWTISKLGQAFLIPGAGPNVCLGPVVFGPNETLIIQISGATPTTTVTGTIWGDQSTIQDGSDLPSTLPTSSGSTPTFQSPQPLLIMVNDGAAHTVNIPLPAGTHSVALYCASPNTTHAITSATSITGHVTQVVYAFSDIGTIVGQTIFSGQTLAQFLVSPYDTSLDIKWQLQAGGSNTPIYVNAYPDPTTVGITSGEILDTVVLGSDKVAVDDWNVSKAWNTGSGVTFNGLLTTFFGSIPAPWQAPNASTDINNNALANNASITIAAGVALKSVYLWTVHLGMNAVSSNVTIEDGAGKVLWRATFNNSTNPVGEDSSFDTPVGGVPGGVAQSLLLFNRSGAAIAIFGSIYWNQG